MYKILLVPFNTVEEKVNFLQNVYSNYSIVGIIKQDSQKIIIYE